MQHKRIPPTVFIHICLSVCLFVTFVHSAEIGQRRPISYCRLGDAPRIENTGSTSWKPLRSSSGHALDDNDDLAGTLACSRIRPMLLAWVVDPSSKRRYGVKSPTETAKLSVL